MIALLLLAQLQAAPALEIRRLPAAEARHGVVAGERYLYAIDNSRIAQYDKASGRKLRSWVGDPKLYPHINSCGAHGRTLVCAASNYPDVPMESSVETFDSETLRPLSSRSLGPGRGSLTWLDWHDGSWWACFANYEGRGGEPGRDYRWTTLVRYSTDFVEQGAWLFPTELLARMAPRSSSGGAWGRDGLLYVTGHDHPELYALRVPSAGQRLQLIATISIPTGGQAIDWDPIQPRTLWSIERKSLEMVASRIPAIPAKAAKP